MVRLISLFVLSMVVFVLSACGSTDLGDQWRKSENPLQKVERAIIIDNGSDVNVAPQNKSALEGQSKDDTGKACLSDLMVIVTYTDGNGVNRSASSCKSADELATCDKIKGIWQYVNNGVFCVIPKASGLIVTDKLIENILIVTLGIFFGLMILRWFIGITASIVLSVLNHGKPKAQTVKVVIPGNRFYNKNKNW